MATPAPYIDQTQGMELTTGDEVALEATRWLFLAGDMIDAQRKEDLPHLAMGGEELDNRCLRRTNGYLPKCAFTPMEIWAEWLPIEFFPEGVRPLSLKGLPPSNDNPSGRTLIGKPLYGFPHYPGELIVDAIGIATGERRGVVELEALRTVDVADGTAQKLEALFFPPDWVRPVELRLVRERIERTAEAHKDSQVQMLARDMLLSCEQFYRYAQHQIDKMNAQLDTRVQHQWTYSYSPKVRLLMKQLEIPVRNTAQSPVEAVLTAMKAQGVTPDVFEQMAQRDENLVAKLGEVFSQALASALKGSQKPNKPSASQ